MLILSFNVNQGATIGLLVGLGTMIFISLMAFMKKKQVQQLPTSIDQCLEPWSSNLTNVGTPMLHEDINEFDRLFQNYSIHYTLKIHS